MARVSFGSRAGSNSDYLAGNAIFAHRTSSANGEYSSLQDLTDALRREIEACTESEVPELTTCELSIREDATIPLLRPAIGPYADGGEHDLPSQYKQEWTGVDEGFPGVITGSALPKATITSILAAPDGQPRQIVQRAASRAIVQALESTDGFKYSFNNAWAAKDEVGLRFSYICQDSMQNKDRHANGFTKTQKHLKGEGERGPRKPTYDCKGSVSVKFSSVRRRVDVYYRHYAIHSSVADRKPAARPPTKPRVVTVSRPAVEQPVYYPEVAPPPPDTGGLFGELQHEQGAYERPSHIDPPPIQNRPQAANVAKPLKRKRESGGPAASPKNPNKPLSLVELLQQSEAAKSPTTKTQAQPKPAAHAGGAPPVEYNLPSWQAPPPAPKAPQYVPPPSTGPSPTQYGGWAGAPYPPPYQPQQYQQQTPSRPGAVAIPRKPSSTSLQQNTPQQAYLGAPQGKQHPQAQGLFSTLKPVRKEEYTVGYEPHFVIYQTHRAKTSCHNCRVSKKKCDEGRPMCGACARSGKIECLYEGAPSRTPNYGPEFSTPAQPQQQPQGTPQSASQTPSAPPTQAVQPALTPIYPKYAPSGATYAYPTQTQTQTPTQSQSYHTAASTQAYSGGAQVQAYATQNSGQSYPSAASSQTFAGTQGQGYGAAQVQQMGGQERERSPDPWFPSRT